MEPDGHIKIEGIGGTRRLLMFTEIRGYATEPFALRIEFPDHREFIPWDQIVHIEVAFNSQDYQEWVLGESQDTDVVPRHSGPMPEWLRAPQFRHPPLASPDQM